MSRENLSDMEVEMVEKMNIVNDYEDDSNIFVQASVCAILQHLIECTDESEIRMCLDMVAPKEIENPKPCNVID